MIKNQFYSNNSCFVYALQDNEEEIYKLELLMLYKYVTKEEEYGIKK